MVDCHFIIYHILVLEEWIILDAEGHKSQGPKAPGIYCIAYRMQIQANSWVSHFDMVSTINFPEAVEFDIGIFGARKFRE